MGYIEIDFDYDIENNKLENTEINIEQTNATDLINILDVQKIPYTPTKGDKLYFLPGVNIPRIKLKDLVSKYGIKVVRNIEDSTIIFGSNNSKDKMVHSYWKYKIPTPIVKLFFDTYSEYIDDYDMNKLNTALEFYTEDYVCCDWSNARMYSDDDFPKWISYSKNPIYTEYGPLIKNSSQYVWKVENQYVDVLDHISNNKLIIIDETELLAQLNGDDAIIIDSEMFENIKEMFDSSDNDNHILAMEIMANSKYKESLLYLEILFKEHSYTMNNSNTKSHVNFKSLLSYLNKAKGYMTTSTDDIMNSLISKNVLTKEKIDIILNLYNEEISNRGDSDFFKVKTITVNEDCINLINQNYEYKVIKDNEHLIVNNSEEDVIIEDTEDSITNDNLNEDTVEEIITNNVDITIPINECDDNKTLEKISSTEEIIELETNKQNNDTDIDWF